MRMISGTLSYNGMDSLVHVVACLEDHKKPDRIDSFLLRKSFSGKYLNKDVDGGSTYECTSSIANSHDLFQV